MSSLFVGLGAAKSIGGNDVLNKSSAVCLSTGTGGGGEIAGRGFLSAHLHKVSVLKKDWRKLRAPSEEKSWHRVWSHLGPSY